MVVDETSSAQKRKSDSSKPKKKKNKNKENPEAFENVETNVFSLDDLPFASQISDGISSFPTGNRFAMLEDPPSQVEQQPQAESQPQNQTHTQTTHSFTVTAFASSSAAVTASDPAAAKTSGSGAATASGSTKIYISDSVRITTLDSFTFSVSHAISTARSAATPHPGVIFSHTVWETAVGWILLGFSGFCCSQNPGTTEAFTERGTFCRSPQEGNCPAKTTFRIEEKTPLILLSCCVVCFYFHFVFLGFQLISSCPYMVYIYVIVSCHFFAFDMYVGNLFLSWYIVYIYVFVSCHFFAFDMYVGNLFLCL